MARRTELLITLCGDIIILLSIFFIAWQSSKINQSVFSQHSIIAGFGLLVFWLFLFQSFNLYKPRNEIQIMNGIFNLLKAIFFGMTLLLSLAYLMNIDFFKAKGFLPSYSITLSSLLLWRLILWGLIGEYVKKIPSRVIIFKNGDNISDCEYPNFTAVREVKFSEMDSETAKKIFKANKIDGIVIESNGQSREEVLKVISQFAESNYSIFVSPKLYPLIYQHFLIKKLPDSSLLQIIFHPLSAWDRFLKRLTDIGIALLSLVILSPLLALIALLIKIDSPGPVFYTQKRVGYRGKKFFLIKFRSMIKDAEKYTGPVWAKKDDKRITRMGRIMRPLRLDELPQLINVLKGDMSFVGPRPERPHFVSKFVKQIPFYSLRHTVHPGITGWAQVKYSYDRTIEDVKKKLEYDLEYINNISLKMDLKIFLKTILIVIKRQGAH
ncbi:MAG: sugar transferase [candidate division WOR-3 bacterium]|nr:sugar transferase [candidate division WOR-3 bacterium]